uniref:Uncharacterized protein n=1 Tax=Arundo donax TaxID=35708 RepID=A0A0A9ERZ4_ARUDO
MQAARAAVGKRRWRKEAAVTKQGQ